MERREFLKLSSLAAATPVLQPLVAQAQAAPEGKPNIIFIVSDQHCAGLTKREGFAFDTSPTLDRMAARGVAFEHAYCTAPLCVPSRTSMLTGRWPEATHIRSNNMIGEQPLYTKHLYQVAKESGYKTGLVGKNHTFIKPKDELDFYRAYELANGYIPPDAPPEYHEYEKFMRSLNANVSLKPTPFPVELSYPYRIVSNSIEFIDSMAGQPFILQVGFSEPHDPEQVPAPYWNMFPPDKMTRCAGPEALKHLGYRAQWEYGHQEAGSESEENWRRYVSNYLGMIRLIDDQLARLVTHLEQKDMMRNTVIVFLADHGDYMMRYGLARKGVGLPECLVNIPMIWSGAGITPTHVGQSAFTSMADVMPTLCEAIGTEIPIGVQGRSLWPLLQGKEYPREEFRSAYSEAGLGGLYYEASDNISFTGTEPEARAKKEQEQRTANGVRNGGFDELNKVTLSGLQKMVRWGDWKLIYDMMGYGQLYNLKKDPCELDNLFGKPEHAAEQAKLMAELCMWTIRCQDSLPTGPQNAKYQTKWAVKQHNWYTPFRHGVAPVAYVP